MSNIVPESKLLCVMIDMIPEQAPHFKSNLDWNSSFVKIRNDFHCSVLVAKSATQFPEHYDCQEYKVVITDVQVFDGGAVVALLNDPFRLLANFNKHLAKECGAVQTYDTYRPHITVGYLVDPFPSTETENVLTMISNMLIGSSWTLKEIKAKFVNVA